MTVYMHRNSQIERPDRSIKSLVFGKTYDLPDDVAQRLIADGDATLPGQRPKNPFAAPDLTHRDIPAGVHEWHARLRERQERVDQFRQIDCADGIRVRMLKHVVWSHAGKQFDLGIGLEIGLAHDIAHSLIRDGKAVRV